MKTKVVQNYNRMSERQKNMPKDRLTERQMERQKDRTTFQFRCQNKSCSLHVTCTAALEPSVLGISECQQDARKIERQADRQTDRQTDFSA